MMNRAITKFGRIFGRERETLEIPQEFKERLRSPALPDDAELEPRSGGFLARRVPVLAAVLVTTALGVGGGYWYGVDSTSDRFLTDIEAASNREEMENNRQWDKWLDRDVCAARASLAFTEEAGKRPTALALDEDPEFLRCVADQRQDVEELQDRMNRIEAGDDR